VTGDQFDLPLPFLGVSARPKRWKGSIAHPGGG